jgi:hypothetical protein
MTEEPNPVGCVTQTRECQEEAEVKKYKTELTGER